MWRRLSCLAVAALSLAACGGPLLFAELEIPDIHVTLPSQSFPASDSSNPVDWCTPAQSSPPCIATTLDYDLAGNVPVLNEQGVTYDLRLTDVAVTLAATEVGKDLRGAELITIRVLDPVDPSASVVVASYARPPGTVAPTSIAVSGNANVDLGPYLRAGRLPVRAEFVFDQLTPAFLADVRVGFSLEVQLDYGKLL